MTEFQIVQKMEAIVFQAMRRVVQIVAVLAMLLNAATGIVYLKALYVLKTSIIVKSLKRSIVILRNLTIM